MIDSGCTSSTYRSFLGTTRTGAPLGDELGLINPGAGTSLIGHSNSSYSVGASSVVSTQTHFYHMLYVLFWREISLETPQRECIPEFLDQIWEE